MSDDRTVTPVMLTEAQLDQIAEAAADRAVKKITDDIYKQVGKTLIERLAWIVGTLVVGTFLWAQSKGWLRT